jgi:hypothetical protein
MHYEKYKYIFRTSYKKIHTKVHLHVKVIFKEKNL